MTACDSSGGPEGTAGGLHQIQKGLGRLLQGVYRSTLADRMHGAVDSLGSFSYVLTTQRRYSCRFGNVGDLLTRSAATAINADSTDATTGDLSAPARTAA